MRARGTVICLAVFVGLSLAPSAARAQCTLFEGSRANGSVLSLPIATGTSNVFFFFRGVAGRSYSVEIFSDHEIGGSTYFFGAPGNNCPTATDVAYNDTSLIDPSFFSPSDGERMSITAAATTFYGVRVTNATGGTITYRYSVADTTQCSTAWTTNGSYDTFYSLYNTTNTTCAGTLKLFNTAGTAVTTQAVSIPSGATLSTNTSAMGTIRNTTGTAQLTHNCPPGAILAEAAIANFSTTPAYVQSVKFQAAR